MDRGSTNTLELVLCSWSLALNYLLLRLKKRVRLISSTTSKMFFCRDSNFIYIYSSYCMIIHWINTNLSGIVMILLIVCWKFSRIMANEVGNPEGLFKQPENLSFVRRIWKWFHIHSERFSCYHCITLLAEFIQHIEGLWCWMTMLNCWFSICSWSARERDNVWFTKAVSGGVL